MQPNHKEIAKTMTLDELEEALKSVLARRDWLAEPNNTRRMKKLEAEFEIYLAERNLRWAQSTTN